MVRWIGRGLVLAGLAAVIGSYAGALHPLGDSLAVFRPVLFVGVLVVCALVWRWRGAWLAAVLCLGLGGWHVASQAGPLVPPFAGDITVYQKNMLFRDYDETALVQDIRASGARMVTLQEVSRAHRDFLAVMEETHPYQLICEGTAVGAVAVLSADPSLGQWCTDAAGMAVMDVAGFEGAGTVRVVALHLHWPWPHRQAEALDEKLNQLGQAGLDGSGAPYHVIVGGDFNMVPWGHSVRRIEDFFGVTRVGGPASTFDLFGLRLSIDHVLAGPAAAGSLSVRPLLGSDHNGLVARIAVNAP